MLDTGYSSRRDRLETYFDETASEAWSRLTSDAPVSGIRATVRQGRERMRRQLLDWLPQDLSGRRILDAGCGTGALAIAAAERGAEVVAVDVAASLVRVAEQRTPKTVAHRITYVVGDMLGPDHGLDHAPDYVPNHGTFDHAVAMDSLIHYPAPEIAAMLATLATRTNTSLLFTFAPATPALRAMHVAGRLFPRGDRAPAILPVSPRRLARLIETATGLEGWSIGRTERVSGGFYTSQGMEIVRS